MRVTDVNLETNEYEHELLLLSTYYRESVVLRLDLLIRRARHDAAHIWAMWHAKSAQAVHGAQKAHLSLGQTPLWVRVLTPDQRPAKRF